MSLSFLKHQLVLIFFLCVLCLPVQAKESVQWQSSVANTVTLGVRDKFGALKKYKAKFLVKSLGKSWSKEILVNGSDWGYVVFPDDFSIPYMSGKYSWHCRVKGKVVLSGELNCKTNKAGEISISASQARF